MDKQTLDSVNMKQHSRLFYFVTLTLQSSAFLHASFHLCLDFGVCFIFDWKKKSCIVH